jgi:chromosomal replication initiation ATPase DnaA
MNDDVDGGARLRDAAGARFRARRALEDRRNDPAAFRVLELVAAAKGVPVPMLLHASRCRAEVALARQLAMYLMHVSLQRQYVEVGRFFGRDRTTVWHACALIEDLRDDLRFNAEVEALEERLDAGDEVGEAVDVAC